MLVWPFFSWCLSCVLCVLVFFFKQKTAYEMRISDWSSDVCSSDLGRQLEHDEPDEVVGDRFAQQVLFPGLAEHARLVVGVIAGEGLEQIGRASWRERVCQYVLISVVAVSLKKHTSSTCQDNSTISTKNIIQTHVQQKINIDY